MHGVCLILNIALSSLIPVNGCCHAGYGLPEMHPVSVIEADIYVTKFKTTMRLKCFAEDLELLQGVEALDDGFYDTEELREATVDHADFLAEKIQLIGTDGKQFQAKVVEIVDFEIPEGQVRQGELMKYTIQIELEFNYEETPEFLTVTQHIVAEDLLLPSELKILLKQEGSDEPYFHMMKPDQPETFRFDWDKPVPDSEASEKEWESWFEKQREQTLGIASYSSVYSFIYITGYEVRHEVLIPLATLNSFFEIERAEAGFLDIAEQDATAEKIKTLFAVGNPVEIDSVQVAPVFDRVDFYGLDLRDFAVRAERRKVSMANGRVGVIMSYSTKGFPRDVKVTWDKFNDVVKTVDSVVFAFDEVSKAEFSMFLDSNTYHWNSSDRSPPPPIKEVPADRLQYAQLKMNIPVLSIACVAFALLMILARPFRTRYLYTLPAALVLLGLGYGLSNMANVEIDHPYQTRSVIEQAKASDIFQQLHKNMFRAFDYHSESEIYDALARSVDGELLEKLYLEITDSLRVAEQGGAVSKIEEVKFLKGLKLGDDAESSDENPQFSFRSQWELLGTVEHWGHIHERNNKYDAEFVVEMVGDDWKITDMNVVDFSHDVVKTRVRKL